MTYSNLAIVFGPNMVWSSTEAASLTGACVIRWGVGRTSLAFLFPPAMNRINTFTLVLLTYHAELFQ